MADHLQPIQRAPRQRKRSKSLTDDNHQYEILRLSQPDRPIHSQRDSLFSSSSGFNNFRGFFNLAIILLVLATLRVALENVIKYGILINYTQIAYTFFGKTSIWPSIISLLLLHVFVLFSYFIEVKLSLAVINEQQAFILIIINLLGIVIFPVVSVFIAEIHPVSASLSTLAYSILFLKMFSYHHVNHWCRQNQRQTSHRRRKSGDYNDYNGNYRLSNENDSKPLIQYPNNLTLYSIFYFLYAPTLCYELNFPRSERRRKIFLLKRLFEVVFLFQLFLALIQQWMVPTISNSLKPLQEMDYFKMLERLLKLAIPNHVIWLVLFYTYFHSALNLVAEILRFGDRQFYRDWWNSESVSYFWKNWNIPVHNWCVRHLYVPLLKKGYSKMTVTSIVFVFSAFFHEYLISVPLKMFGYWAFVGMVFQIPMAVLVSLFLNGTWANISVWFSLIIGQPLCILACYHDYFVIHYDVY